MILRGLILAATVAATPPSPIADVTPVVRARSGQTRTRVDVARERKLGAKGVQGVTMPIAGAPLNAPATGAVTTEADAFQAEWIKKNADTWAEDAAAADAHGAANATLPRYIVPGRGW